MKYLSRILVLLVLCTSICLAQGPASNEAIDSTVAEFMEHNKSTAVAVGLIVDGHIAYVHSYGAMKNDQPFDLASLSKSLTGIVAARYAEQGRLELDAPVSKYLPEVKLPPEVTVRLLLGHMSGLPHYNEHYPVSNFTLANFTPDSLAQAPGKGFIYSSPGYYLLSKVLEKIDHRPFLQQMNDELAVPADAAPLKLDPSHGWRLGSGGLMASPDSLTHIALALLEGKILDPKGFELLCTPVATSEGYALGFYVDEGPPVKLSHNGSHPDDGIATRWVLYPASRNGLIVLTQSEKEANVSDLATAILHAIK